MLWLLYIWSDCPVASVDPLSQMIWRAVRPPRCKIFKETGNTLQHTATRCSTLHHTQQDTPAAEQVTTCCSTTCCSVLQCVAVLQHTATRCTGNTLQHTATRCRRTSKEQPPHVKAQHTAEHCNTLQHLAKHCRTYSPHDPIESFPQDLDSNTLPHISTHCKTLQHIPTAWPNQVFASRSWLHTSARCNTMQHAATHYNTHLPHGQIESFPQNLKHARILLIHILKNQLNGHFI